jgi:photosystem II stability/assembly factor-like uncharacterized protein
VTRFSLGLALVTAVLSVGCHRKVQQHARRWRWENPVPQGNRLSSTCVDRAGRAYAVGHFGAILTRNSGEPWRSVVVSTRAHLSAVTCSLLGVFVAGSQGTLLRSTDRGVSWLRLSTHTQNDLFSVASTDDLVLAGGASGTLLQTHDGEHWNTVSSHPDGDVFGLWITGTLALAVGRAGALYRSENAGIRWERVETGTQHSLSAVWASAPDDAYAVGSGGTILVSSNRGAQWTILPRTVDEDLYAVTGRGRHDVYISGAAGLLLHARDGVQFVREGSALTDDIYSVASNGDGMVAVGVRGSMTERGANGSWRAVIGGHRGSFHSVWRSSRGRACAVGQGGAIFCRDAMDDVNGWSRIASGMAVNLAAIDGDESQTLMVVGDQGTSLRSTDEGRTWALTTVPDDTTLAGVWLGTRGLGVIVGRGGHIRQSRDGGAHWQQVTSGVTEGFMGVWGRDDGNVWACGMRGTIVHSSDGGTTWETQSSGFTGDLFALWGNPQEVYATGREGTVLHTYDGTHWQHTDTGVHETLVSVTGHGTNVWAVGLSGKLVRSQDHGAHWRQEDIGTGDDLNGIVASSDGIVTAVGYWGTILTRRLKSNFEPYGHANTVDKVSAARRASAALNDGRRNAATVAVTGPLPARLIPSA